MSASLLPYLYTDLAYTIVLNLLFGVFFVRQVLKLDKLGENFDVKVPRKVWLKFGIILTIDCLLALHLILSYGSKGYWLNDYSNFALLVFMFLANYTMQAYIVIKMVSKGGNRRYLPNIFYWIYCTLSSLIEVIVVQVR